MKTNRLIFLQNVELTFNKHTTNSFSRPFRAISTKISRINLSKNFGSNGGLGDGPST